MPENDNTLMDSNLERWYLMKEICEYLGVSCGTMLAWIEKEVCPPKNRTPLEIQGKQSGRLAEIRRSGRVVI